jgi:hypothetical protein
MAELDPVLVSLATSAAQHPNKWGRVLEHIMNVTGAPAAMITLREKKNCQIVNDDVLEQEFHSPLIRGFPSKVVDFYLNELRTIDPWAMAQIKHYPSRPLLMSAMCPPEEADDKRFFEWLKALGIIDTIAFELDCLSEHWTACNIFMTEENTLETERLLAYTNTHHELLKNTWQTSQELIRSNQLSKAALNVFGQMEIPACIVDAGNSVIASNSVFDQVVSSGEIDLIGAKAILSVGHEMDIFSEDDWGISEVARHESLINKYRITSQRFNPDPMYHDKKKKFRLLILQPLNDLAVKITDAMDLKILTRIERLLLEGIKNGSSIADAGKEIGYGRTRTYEIWSSVKEKLSISSSHQLR